MNEPLSFKDPSSFPIVFKKKQQSSIMYGQNVYPITFKFNSRPRFSNIATLAADVRGFLMVDRDVFNDISVGAFNKDSTHRIELILDSKDPEYFNPFIQIRVSGNQPMILKPGNIAHIRQSASISDINHIFSMESSTQLLNPISSLYATASLNLSFSHILKNNNNVFDEISLPDKNETLVLLKPANASGILDIIAELKLNWYEDQSRTILYTGTPPLIRNDKFGIRFYITDFGLFSNKVQIQNDGIAIVNDIPPQSYLDKINQPAMNVMYFGNGTRDNDLFTGIENGIKIDDSGLPIQLGNIVPVYILDNKLDDIESSSVSSINSSSSSSENTSSSSSLSSSTVSQSSMTSFSESTGFPLTVCVSGAGKTLANGSYEWYEAVPPFGYDNYINQNGLYYIHFDGVYWYIFEDGTWETIYTSVEEGGEDPVGLTYISNNVLNDPPPVVSRGGCP